MSKSQISSQMFIYLAAAVIIVLILIFGFKSISTIINTFNTAELDKFKSDISSSVKKMSEQSGSNKKYQFTLQTYFEEVCFVNSLNENNEFEVNLENVENVFVRDSIENNAEANVFLIKDSGIEDSFYVENLQVVDGIQCFENDGLIEFWMEGKGRYALLKNGQ